MLYFHTTLLFAADKLMIFLCLCVFSLAFLLFSASRLIGFFDCWMLSPGGPFRSGTVHRAWHNLWYPELQYGKPGKPFGLCDRNFGLVQAFVRTNKRGLFFCVVKMFFPVIFQHRWVCYAWSIQQNCITVFDPFVDSENVSFLEQHHCHVLCDGTNCWDIV